MTFSQAIASGFSKYFIFSGRALQSEFWYWVLFAILGMIVTQVFDGIIFIHRSGELPSLSPLHSPLNFLFILVLLLPSIAVSVRRLHDVDLAGWWMLLAPTGIGILILLYMKSQQGTIGSNKFGPDPRSLGNTTGRFVAG